MTRSARVFRSMAALLVPAMFVLSGCGVERQLTAQGAEAQSANLPTAAPERDAQPGSTLGLTYIPNIQFSAVYVAQDDSMFTAAGQITEVRHHGAEEGLFTALLSGQEDLVLASGDEALMARKEGLDLISVGTYYQQNPVAILVREDSPIRSIVDLKGKRIGIPGEYGSSWIGLQAILESEGMTTSDVEVASIGYTQLAALSGGDVDAIVGFKNNEAVWFGSAGTPVRVLEHKELPLVSASLITTRERFEERTNAICSLVRATEAGMKRTTEVPQRAVESTQTRDQSLTDPKAVEGARAVLKETITLFAPAGQPVTAEPDTAKWQAMLDFYSTHFGEEFKNVSVEDVVSQRCFHR